MNPEECQTECEIKGIKVPSFYDLERFHKFHPHCFQNSVLLQKGREHTCMQARLSSLNDAAQMNTKKV